MKYKVWEQAHVDGAAIDGLIAAGHSPLVARVLCARGLDTPEKAGRFLAEGDAPLCDPYLIEDMDRAAGRVAAALERGETMAVYGDYDVDGITSTCLLARFLRARGGRVIPYIPDRLEEGYGLNPAALESLRDRGVTLVITVDCGITALTEVAGAVALGMDVVVTDHHECKEDLPAATAVVDPCRPGGHSPTPFLAGVGVALKLALALTPEQERERVLAEYADLAAIGTVADVVPLAAENRTIVARGLDALKQGGSPRPGLNALLREACGEREVCATMVGFALAPRINAAGRMGKADVAVELLLTDDPARGETLARYLCALNRERQSLESEIFEDCLRRLEREPIRRRRAIVLADAHWHQGVVGIVASRLAERFSCPTFMICLQDGRGKASCRSFGDFDLFRALEDCSDLLEGFGGHKLAAGFTIREENIDAFRSKMEDYVDAWSGGAPLTARLRLDGELEGPELLTAENVEGLRLLEPFGAGNPKPVFGLAGCTVAASTEVGGGRHLKLRLSRCGQMLDAIFFSMNAAALGVSVGDRVDAAFTPQINDFRGMRTVQLLLCDLRPAVSRAEAERAMYDRLCQGESISPQEAAEMIPSRAEFTAVWRYLKGQARQGRVEDTARRLARNVAKTYGMRETIARTMVCLTVFHEHGLIRMERSTDHLCIDLSRPQKKVDLDTAAIMRRLRKLAGE